MTVIKNKNINKIFEEYFKLTCEKYKTFNVKENKELLSHAFFSGMRKGIELHKEEVNQNGN